MGQTKNEPDILRIESTILLGCAIEGLEKGVEDCRERALHYHERSTHYTNMAAALTLRLREYQERLAALGVEQEKADANEQPEPQPEPQQREQQPEPQQGKPSQAQQRERIPPTRLRIPPASFWSPSLFWKRPARNEE